MGKKECNKCKKKELGWDYDYNKKTGKWRLEDHRRKDGKWCNKLYTKTVKTYMGRKKDYVKCELCLGNSGNCFVDDFFERHPEVSGHTLSEHKAMYHPNNEILDDIDFMILTDEEKIIQRKRISAMFG